MRGVLHYELPRCSQLNHLPVKDSIALDQSFGKAKALAIVLRSQNRRQLSWIARDGTSSVDNTPKTSTRVQIQVLTQNDVFSNIASVGANPARVLHSFPHYCQSVCFRALRSHMLATEKVSEAARKGT